MNLYTDIHIGHPGDALTLLEQLLEKTDLDQDTVTVLMAIKDALERSII